MRRTVFHKIVWLVVAVTAVLTAFSCQREGVPAVHMRPVGEAVMCSFSADPTTPFEQVDTKSKLASDIETKYTGVSIGVYYNGELMEANHYSPSSEIVFNMFPGQTYKLYALANMGDMTESFPVYENEVSSIVYSIPYYTKTNADDSVDARGIPMAGLLEYTPGVSASSNISLIRLFAKIIVTLTTDWEGASFDAAFIMQANKNLKPFGVSSIENSPSQSGMDYLLTSDNVDSGSPSVSISGNTVSFALYIPENIPIPDGISNITDPSQKDRYNNQTIDQNAGKLTYLWCSYNSSGKYEGEVSYHHYLGENATTDFNIYRNKLYTWDITYHSAKLNDYSCAFKRVLKDLQINSYSLSVNCSNPLYIAVGESITPEIKLNHKVNYWDTSSWPYEEKSTTTSSVIPASSLNMFFSTSATYNSLYEPGDYFYSEKFVDADESTGKITGVHTTNIPASEAPWWCKSTYGGDPNNVNDEVWLYYPDIGPDLSVPGLKIIVYVTDASPTISYELELVKTSVGNATYQSPAIIQARFWTKVDDVRTGEPTDVTDLVNWSCSPGSPKYTVSAGTVSAHPTNSTPSVAGTTSVTASYTFQGNNYNAIAPVSVTFVDVQAHELEIVKTSAGNGDYQHPVTFRADYWNTTNSFKVGSASNVTSSATWSVTQPLSPNRYAVSGGSVSADASVGNHSVAGSPMVTATYSGKTSPQATATFVDVMTYPVAVRLDDGTDANGTKLAVGAQKKFKAWYEIRMNGYVTSSGYQSATWSSTTSPGAVTITPATSNNPTVTGVTSGSVVLTATVQGHTGIATITVIPWSDDWDDPGEEIEL